MPQLGAAMLFAGALGSELSSRQRACSARRMLRGHDRSAPMWYRTVSLLVAAMALSLIAGCAEVHRVGDTLQAWMRDYSWGTYRATPQQTQIASQRATRYYAKVPAAKKQEMKSQGKRYLAVRTADPSPQQLKEIKKKASSGAYGSGGGGTYGGRRSVAAAKPAATPAPTEYKCVMIFDTQAMQVVGNNCYAVTTLPQVGEIARFEGYTAEFIGPVQL